MLQLSPATAKKKKKDRLKDIVYNMGEIAIFYNHKWEVTFKIVLHFFNF